jgi:two-component system, OmpR family, sensor histidine kinase VicK
MDNRADYNFIVKYGEITPDGVAVYDLNSRKFVYVNRFLSNIFEGADKNLIKDASSIMKIVHPEDLVFVENRYRELLSIGCIAPTEFRIVLPGQVKHVSCEVLWLEESYTFAIFARDISALKEHEDYVVKFSAQKDTLLDMLIHNLSGPLYMSRGVLSLVNAGGHQQSENFDKQLGLLRDSTENCIEIINDFMKEEHETSAQVSVKNSRFDILEKIEVALQLLREMNKEKRFEVKASLTDRNMSADPVKFLQIMQNILSNSVKYTDDNGIIAVEIKEDGLWVEFVVRDNGTGIPAAILPLLTKQRVLGVPGLRGEKSKGVGLLLTSTLVDLMKGRITIESVENEGCTVTLTLPRE